jgi:signal transduction histidine kinase
MRRRLVVSNLVLITVVLLLLELPLGIVYARHEHDSLSGALQRDAGSLASLSEEIIEHPGQHDVGALAKRFSTGVGGEIVILDRAGSTLTSTAPASNNPPFQAALRDARAGHPRAGEVGGLAYVSVPIGAVGESHGAVLIARSDAAIDHHVHQFWLVLIGIGLGVLAISVIVSRRLSLWAVEPLRELDDRADALGRGELHVRADTGAGPSEVVALAVTFNEMADRLDELVTSQRRFVADASHQLRTPLTALRLRLENLETDDATTIATTRDAALLETTRLTRIVDGLLALARAERHRPERQPVDVSAVVDQRHEAWAPLAAEHDIELRLESNGATLTCAMIVPGHLDQILDNLIDNALDATAPNHAVRLIARTVGSIVEIHVVDEGRGMTDEERQRAFDPFWQNPEVHANGSVGLGLAIVDQLLRASSGTVELQTSPGGGIDATVRFPCTDHAIARDDD